MLPSLRRLRLPPALGRSTVLWSPPAACEAPPLSMEATHEHVSIHGEPLGPGGAGGGGLGGGPWASPRLPALGPASPRSASERASHLACSPPPQASPEEVAAATPRPAAVLLMGPPGSGVRTQARHLAGSPALAIATIDAADARTAQAQGHQHRRRQCVGAWLCGVWSCGVVGVRMCGGGLGAQHRERVCLRAGEAVPGALVVPWLLSRMARKQARATRSLCFLLLNFPINADQVRARAYARACAHGDACA